MSTNHRIPLLEPPLVMEDESKATYGAISILKPIDVALLGGVDLINVKCI